LADIPGQAAHPFPAKERIIVTIGVMMAVLLQVLDTTIANVALPHMQASLGATQESINWVLTSYIVASAIALPISGWLADRVGRKRLLLISVIGFTVASVLCAVSVSLTEMVFFRVLQGISGAFIVPLAQATLFDINPREKHGQAMAMFGGGVMIGPILGPVLGGWLTDSYSWRWVFLINIPVGIAMCLAVVHLIEDPPWAKAGRRGAVHTDYIGLGFIVLGLGCLQVMLDRGEDDDWFGSPFIRLLAVLAAIGLVGGVYWLLYARKPIVDLRVFKDRNFAVGALTLFAMAVVLYASVVAVSQLAQRQYGYTATWAGLVLSPGAAVLLLVIPVVTRVLHYVQIRFVVASGFVCLGLSMVYAHHLSPQIDFETLALIRIAQSASIGMLLAPISTLAYTTLPRELNADATALFTMLRNLGGSIGISVATTVVIERSQVRQAYLVGDLSPLAQAYDNTLQHVGDALAATGTAPSDVLQTATGWIYQALLQQAGILAYTDLFALGAILCFLMAPIALLFSLVKADGVVVAGH
jgi:MFS transporter, DHA2 family, multidrug resistance protein